MENKLLSKIILIIRKIQEIKTRKRILQMRCHSILANVYVGQAYSLTILGIINFGGLQTRHTRNNNMKAARLDNLNQYMRKGPFYEKTTYQFYFEY